MSSLPSQPERRPQVRRAWINRSTMALPLLCLIIFGAIIGTHLIGNATNADAASLVPLNGNIPSLVKTSTLIGPADPNQNLSLSIGLKLRNAEALKPYADNTIRSQSTHKPQHLTSAQISTAFAPLASSEQAVIDYLQGYGFQASLTGKLHLIIGFKGTVDDAEHAFHIQINNYISSEGAHFYASPINPSVPANLAGLIQNIAGLDNSVHLAHAPITTSKSANMNLRSQVQANVTCISAGTGYFIPSQIASAYDLKTLQGNGFHGEGQTVALLELDDYLPSDISNYTSCYGGNQVPINKIKVDGGASLGAGAIEDELDIELILSAAPKLASLEVYEAPRTSAGELDVFSRMVSDNTASVISTSWGACEASMPSAQLTAENNLFAIAAAQGQTVLAASGDAGTNECRKGTASVDDPASQPYVTGVGGTTLTLNGSSYGGETVWNDSYGAGGGGISSVWPLPSWQSGPGVSNNYSNGYREVPDVSLNADPATGYVMYCSVSTACKGHTWVAVGGTSAAAPLWAAFLAIANEKSLQENGFNLGFINPLLYQVRQNLGWPLYLLNGFHDVTSGNNDTLGDGLSKYPATTDYDQASGLGSFSGWNLVGDLETLASHMRDGGRPVSGNTTWYFAEGSVGGQFTQYLTILNPSSGTASVFTQYFFENRPSVTWGYTVYGNTRITRSVNDDLGIPASAPQQAISMIVTSNVPIVAERPLYFNAHGVASGTDVLGATSTATSFYFAAGDSSSNSQEFLEILNPNTSAANVTVSYYSNGQLVENDPVTVGAQQRGTTNPTKFHGQAAIQVTSDQPIVVERSEYFNGNVPNAGGATTGASATMGVTTQSTDWLFAEGYTGQDFQENLVLANFASSGTPAATATIKLEYTNGTVQTVQQPVNAQSQIIFDVNNANRNPNCGLNGNPACTVTNSVSIEVTATAPIVAERVQYFHFGLNGSMHPGMDDVVGQVGPASQSVYTFAEGQTGTNFNDWLTLQNPNSTPVVAAITIFADNTIIQKELTLPAHSRTSVLINSIVNPIVAVYPNSAGYTVSMDVQSFGGPIVAERPLYFTFKGGTGASDIIGYTGH